MKICCFTGHRPKFFPWKDNEEDPRCQDLKNCLRGSILEALSDGFDYFITGGALGVDTWAGEIILEVKSRKQVFFEIAVPFESYNKNLEKRIVERLDKIQNAADKVTIVSRGVGFGRAFYERDHYMVDKSRRIIAVYDEWSNIKSATYLTLQYAKKKGIEIRQIEWMHPDS